MSYKNQHSTSSKGMKKNRLNDVVHAEMAGLSMKLRKAGLSTANCMIVVRSGQDFYVAAAGMSAMNHRCAAEDFARMLRASFDNDEMAKSFLVNMLQEIQSVHADGDDQ